MTTRIYLSILTLCLSFGLSAQQTLDQQVDSLVNLMTIQEKIDQLINNGFMTTPSNSRLEIPGFVMNDGPHGPRFDPSTSYPVGISIASSFDRDLAYRVGKAMGEEFWGWNKDVQLGPCIDLCRDPRNGRSGETGGEDPYLAGEMGINTIRGIQENPVIATTKHYNGVNKQDYRHESYVTISERNLMEHYGINFQKAVQQGGSMAIMSSYNLINNEKAAESHTLLTTILRERWGFPFFVMSDWAGIWNSENAINAGNDLCMGSEHYRNDLYNLWNTNTITDETINKAVRNVLRTKILSGMLETNRPEGLPTLSVNTPEHHELCHEAGQKAMILLKNQDNILPLDANTVTKILLVGPSANIAQLDGFGSAWVTTNFTTTPREGIESKIGSSKVDYTWGCNINDTDYSDFDNAKAKAATADVVIFVGGLDDTMEGEGYGAGGDRKNGTVTLPEIQFQLINELAAINPNTVVVLNSGGVCAVNPFINNIKGLIYAFYPGQEGGAALADVLFGDYNPAGRLPVTMPKNDSQIQTQNENFDDDYLTGYRYYDASNITPEYPFGFGLSYTSFTYSNIQTSGSAPVLVSVDITNTGSVPGEEVAQLYLSDDASSVWMPEKQLKGFERIQLDAGQTKTVTFELKAEDFSYWDEATHTYTIEAGTFTARVGPHSGDLPETVSVNPSGFLGQPDLAITQVFSLPRYPLDGDIVTFYALVINQGPQATTNVNHEVIASINGHSISGTWSEGIPAGGMKMIPLSTQPWTAIDGENTLTATVDGNNSILESDENNNGFERIIKVGLNVEDPGENLCLNKPTTASSTEDPEYEAAMATDGDLSTRWASGFFDNQTLDIDLQDLYLINKFKIYWESAYSDNYTIEVAETQEDFEANNWTLAVTATDFGGGVSAHAVDIPARYLRITCLTRATEWGSSIVEFQAFGVLESEQLSLDKTAIVVPVGSQEQLSASFPNVTWESYIPTIASVDQTGLVTGLIIGQTQIIARSEDGTQIASCNVAVIDADSVPSKCSTSPYTLPAQIEAECFHAMFGIDEEDTEDVGGGKNIGFIDINDWFEYDVDVNASTSFKMDFRVAGFNNGLLTVFVDGSEIKTVTLPITNGWQTWETAYDNLDLDKGSHTIRFVSASDGFNINWIKFSGTITSTKNTYGDFNTISAYPNPTNGHVIIKGLKTTTGHLSLVNSIGLKVMDISISNNLNGIEIDLSSQPKGIYFLRDLTDASGKGIQIIKE